jgi:hypothetical protein
MYSPVRIVYYLRLILPPPVRVRYRYRLHGPHGTCRITVSSPNAVIVGVLGGGSGGRAVISP